MMEVPGDNDRLTLTVDEAAKLLGISKWAVYECARTGQLPSVKLGRRVLIPRHQLARMVDGGPGPLPAVAGVDEGGDVSDGIGVGDG